MSESLKRNVMLVVAVLAVGACGYYIWAAFGSDESVQAANKRVLKDAETGELFEFDITPDTPPYPHENPKTHKKTLYPTELCYWDQCGKKGGTRVTLNAWLGKPEPTHCPVCGHVVRVHNPAPPDWKGVE